jgi:hypothetical protein
LILDGIMEQTGDGRVFIAAGFEDERADGKQVSQIWGIRALLPFRTWDACRSAA